MAEKTTQEFKDSAEAAPLNGWTDEEKGWLRMIGMTEDKPTDPDELEAYWDREYRAYRRWRKNPLASLGQAARGNSPPEVS